MSFYFPIPFVSRSAGTPAWRSATCWVGSILLAFCLLPGLSVTAQLQLNPVDAGSGSKTDGSGSSTRNDELPQDGQQKLSPGKLFQLMLGKIKQNDADINRLYSTMPLGFPALQKEHLDAIDVLKAQTDQLRAGLPSAAIEAFKAEPGENAVATQFVFQTLNEMIDPKLPDSVFDPKTALQLVDTLIDAGADQNLVVLSKGFRASFALEDFDRASLMLDRIADANPEGDLAQIRQVVDEAKEKWQRELSIRRLEKNNDSLPIVKFETTAGDFEVVLYEDHAPNTVANFISLVEKKFYNDLTFHYVKPGEYIHTGCPNGDGSGNPGYSIASEYDREQIRDFFSATLGMANTGSDTEGSQFVITHQPIPQLDGRFTAFGRVIEGFDVVQSAKAISPQDALPLGDEVAPEPIRIIKAEVLRKRDHEYEPKRAAKPRVGELLGGLDNSSESDNAFGPRSASEDVPAVDGGGLFSPSNP